MKPRTSFKKLDRKIDLIHERAYIKIATKMAKEANYRHIEDTADTSQTCEIGQMSATPKTCEIVQMSATPKTCETCSRPCTASWVLGKVWADKYVCDFWRQNT